MVGRVQMVPPSEEWEISALYREHAPRVARWAARLGGPGVDVEDVVQEVFLVAFRRLREFRGEARVTTWLYRITENIVRHQRRKLRWRRWLTGRAHEATMSEDLHPTPLEALEKNRAARSLYAALDRLPEKYRTPFILFEIEGIATEEISALLGIKLGTLWVRLHRARSKLAESLSPSSGSGGKS